MKDADKSWRVWVGVGGDGERERTVLWGNVSIKRSTINSKNAKTKVTKPVARAC